MVRKSLLAGLVALTTAALTLPDAAIIASAAPIAQPGAEVSLETASPDIQPVAYYRRKLPGGYHGHRGGPGWGGPGYGHWGKPGWGGGYWRKPGWNGHWGNGWYGNHWGYNNHWHGHHNHWHGYPYYNYGWYGGAPWWYYGALVAPYVYGAYSSGYYDNQNYGNAHVQWCLNRYRSYNPATDTFVGYDGYRHRCRAPY